MSFEEHNKKARITRANNVMKKLIDDSKELEELKNGIQMYRTSDNKLVRVHAILVADIMDRPERCTITGILGHGGNWTKLWKHSLDLNIEKALSCDQCWSKRLNKMNEFYLGGANDFKIEFYKCANFN